MTDELDIVFKDIQKKMEAVGFIFEGKQVPRNQKRKTELKFTHSELNEKLSQDGNKNRARKYYIKPLADGDISEIGITTGSSTKLLKHREIHPPNATDSFGSNPAWVNRPNDDSLDKFLESIRRVLNGDEVTTLSSYYEDFVKEIELSKADMPDARKARLKLAIRKPEKMRVWATVYKRNPDVVAEVLIRAKGICEECGEKAPFIRKNDQSAYLEVHHVVQLSAGGDDTVENAIGVCPNCHRKAHFG